MSSNSLSVEQPRLLAEPVFQILGAAAENFGFGGLRHQLLLEFGDAAAEIFDLAALFGQFLGRRFELDPLGIAAVFHGLEFVAGVGEPLLQRLDLGLERDDLDLLGCRPVLERSSSSPISLASSASLSDSARSASCMALVLTANSSSVARN